MPAYLIAFVTPYNLDWLAEYAANVPKIIHDYGGKYLAVPKAEPGAVEVIEGQGTAPASIVLFSFPSVDAIKNFMSSPEYAPYREARNAGSECIFYSFLNDENAPQLSGQPS